MRLLIDSHSNSVINEVLQSLLADKSIQANLESSDIRIQIIPKAKIGTDLRNSFDLATNNFHPGSKGKNLVDVSTPNSEQQRQDERLQKTTACPFLVRTPGDDDFLSKC